MYSLSIVLSFPSAPLQYLSLPLSLLHSPSAIIVIVATLKNVFEDSDLMVWEMRHSGFTMLEGRAKTTCVISHHTDTEREI